MSVKNVHREYVGVFERTSEAWHHHKSSQSTTDRKEGHIQAMMRYIKEQGSPFSTQCPPVLHNFVTNEVMTQGIRNDVLNASERGKKKFETFYSERFTNKTSKLRDTIHKENHDPEDHDHCQKQVKEDYQKGHPRTKYEREIIRNSSRSRSNYQGYFDV